MKFCRQILPPAMALVLLLAIPVIFVRSAKTSAPPIELQVKAPNKVLYIIQNPENFKDGVDSTLLQSSYKVFANALNDKGRVRTHYDGDNYNTCAPTEVCDKVVIQRNKQSISVMIRCKTETEAPTPLPAGEIKSPEEIQGILIKIVRVVELHDKIHQ